MSGRMGWHRSSLAVAMAWSVFSGCGGDSGEPPTVPVSGTLAVEGKPVSNGTIHFHPEKGRTATGIVKDGKFTLTTYTDGDGGIAGKNKVAVEVVQEVPMKDGDTTTKSLIPVKFTNPDQSGVALEIPAKGYSNLQIDIVGNAVKIKEE
jgi:hypothetical protein